MTLFKRLQRWRKQRQLRQHRIPLSLWTPVVDAALAHYRLNHHELHQLRELASLFLQQKVITGAGGQQVDDTQRVIIAAEACLLILNLNLDYFAGWQEVIVYPGSFVVQHEEQDELGLVHEQRAVLGGEAWGRGPVILAWDDARPNAHPHGEDSNVILHEFAHKLDMLNGKANGMPPLHAEMNRQTWTEVFSRTFEQLQSQVQRHHRTCIDPYGAENPAEFFAVLSEEFFQMPAQLKNNYPAVYDQLRQFYRQDPVQR